MTAIQRVLRAFRGHHSPQGEEGREENAAFYDGHFENPATRPRTYAASHYYFLWAVIVDRLRRRGFGRVLEIGCGPGYLATFLHDQGVRDYVGVDFSSTALRFARRAVPGARFVEADARTTTIHAEYDHDVVVCTEVLEHVEADLEIVRRFVPGKWCICSVPNFAADGHVRTFRDSGEVAARYGSYFDSLDVMTLESPNGYGDRFFLFEGTRSAFGAPGQC